METTGRSSMNSMSAWKSESSAANSPRMRRKAARTCSWSCPGTVRMSTKPSASPGITLSWAGAPGGGERSTVKVTEG